MTRRFTTRTAGIFAALLLASCFGDSTGPGERRPGMISIAPDFNVRGINSVDVNRVLIRFTKPNSTVTVYDTIVPFPATTDTLDLSIHLAISGASEQFLMTILMIDDPAADTVFQSGPTLITAVAGVTPPVPTPATFTYVGVGSHAAGVRFLATPSQVLNGDTVLFAAEAFDSSGLTIPNTPIVWTSSDTVRAKVPADSIGRIIGGVGRGNVTITAALLTPPTVTSPLLVQPKPSTILVQGGSGQTGTVGLPLSQPVAVQVRASDNLGVQGVVVNFAATTGGGTLSQLADTTDVNGNASTVWTLGGTAGAQSVGVTVGGVAGTTSVPATGVAGALKKLGFTALPASVISGLPITPPITVAAQDTFGNLVAGFTGAVTLAIGANPAGGTLSGTTTAAAVAGVATFNGLSIDNIGASYTFVATATGLVSATSGGLAVTAPAGANAWINAAGGNWGTPANWSKGTVPSATDTVLIHQTGTYTVNLDVSPTVARLDLGATTGLQTLSIAANTLTMNGNGTVTANGKILMTGGTIAGAGVVDVFGGLDWQGGSLSGGGGTLRVRTGGTLSISGATARTLNAYTLESGGGAAWTGTGVVSSGGGGTLRVPVGATLDIQGDPTFSFNQGGAASLFDNQGTLLRSTSTGTVQLGVAFTNNGTTNVTSGTLSLSNGGTLSGTMNANGAGILSLAAGTFTMANNLAFGGTGALQLNGATLSGLAAGDSVRATVSAFTLNTGALSPGAGGTVKVTGSLNWAGAATLGGGGKTLTSGAGGISISGATARTLTGQTLEIGGAGANTWTGAFTMSSGSGAVLRVLSGASFSIQSASSYLFNLGGGPSLLENQGSLTFAPGAAAVFTTSATFNNTGNIIVSNGTASLGGGGLETGAVNVGTGAFVDYAGGTHTLNNGVVFSGAGTARLQAGTITNATVADTARFVNLQLNGGIVSQVGGMLAVGGTLDWAGGATISGTGTVAGNNVVTFTGTAGRTLTNGIFENRGNATWSGAFALSSGSGAILRNAAGRSFVISADASYQYSLGGAKSVFQNLGTLNSGAPTLMTVSASLNSTSTLNITAGTLRLSGDAQLGGAIAFSAAANVLDIPSGTDTLKTGLTVTGAGFVTVSGGTLTADSGITFTIPNLQVTAGNLAHEALVQATSTFGWSGGTISSNTVGLGGTTRVASGAVATINNAGGIGLTGTHILDIVTGATANYIGAGSMSTGSGAVVQNAGSFNWQGAGSILFNLGGAVTQFRLLGGTLLRNTSAATVNLGAQMNWTAGAITVSTGVLQLGGGSVTSFAGNATVTPANGLDLSAGTFTLSNNVTVTGDLLVSGGSLVLNGHKVTSNNFSTSGAGAITMNLALDTLDVNTNALFAGGASTLTAGGIRVAGNFSQATGANAFAASGAHTTLLDGGAAQTVSFTNATTSFFRRLEINKAAGGVVLGADARVTGTLRIISPTAVTGATARLTVLDSIKSPTTSSSLTPLVVEVGNWLASDSGAFSPDTAVFLVGSATATPFNIPTGVFTTYVYKSIRVAADTVTALGTLNVANDLVVGGLPAVSATLAIATGTTINVTGNLRTEGNGKLKMTNATTTLNVAGSATFAGGATTGLLSTGLLTIKGNFSQSGNAASFLGSGTHVTRFDLAGSAVVQNINFANPTTSAFDSLDLNRGPGTRGTVNFQTDARILRGLSLQNSTDVTGAAARISIVGGSLTASQSTTSPTMLTTRALELAVTPPALANMVGAVNISPDTVVINTGITTLPVASGLRYNSIRVNTGANLTMSIDTITKDLHVATGTAVFSGATTYQVNGKLRTTGTGALSMTNAGANVTVADSAIFSGGSTNGLLTAGFLRLKGFFFQGGGNTAAFSATAAHQTEFSGTAQQNVSMANAGVGAADSHFGALRLQRAGGIVKLLVQSNLNAGLISDTSLGFNDSIIGTGFTLVTADSIQLTSTVFNNMPLSLNSNNALIQVQSLRFENMDQTITQFTINRNGASTSTITGMVFQTPPTTGHYFAVNQAAAGSVYSVTFNGTLTPATGAAISTLYTRTGPTLPTVIWAGVTNP